MPSLPPYLDDQTFSAILSRMLLAIPDGIDKTEGSFIYDALAPAALELADMAANLQDVLRFSNVSTTSRDYLDLKADEHGLTRRAAAQATGAVTFTGANGTVIPAGTVVSTSSLPNSPAVEFTTDESVTITGGVATVAITASIAEARGNVSAATVVHLISAVVGVSSVTNVADTTGGADTETDEELLVRFYAKVRNPSAGGNVGDYLTWAFEVPGVGAARAIPVFYGNGTVLIAVLNQSKDVPSQTLLDAVLDHISDPIIVVTEAEDLTVGGFGTSTDSTLTDDSGDSVKMVYSVSGDGTITGANIDTLLVDGNGDPAPGIYSARFLVKVDDSAGVADLFDYGVWNVTAAGWADLSPSNTADAHDIAAAADLTTDFGYVSQQFYWNGSDNLETRVKRLVADTVTVLWVDLVRYQSTFSDVAAAGLAPVGATVHVEGAVPVTINVSATLTIKPTYNVTAVKDAATANIVSYLQSLALQDDNDVRVARVETAVLDAAGVVDCLSLLVNGGTSNVTIAVNEFAKAGTITLS